MNGGMNAVIIDHPENIFSNYSPNGCEIKAPVASLGFWLPDYLIVLPRSFPPHCQKFFRRTDRSELVAP